MSRFPTTAREPFVTSAYALATDNLDVRISAGAKVPVLATVGWVSIGGRLLLLTVAGALFVQVARRPRNRATASPVAVDVRQPSSAAACHPWRRSPRR
jgi:hypothetical protein